MGSLATLLQLLCVVILWSLSSARSDLDPDLDPDLGRVRYLQTQVDKRVDTDLLFDQYKVIFNRSYERDDQRRRDIFKRNVRYIQQHNLEYARGNKSYTLGVNGFSDLKHEEFLRLYTSRLPLRRTQKNLRYANKTVPVLPGTIDWRNQGYVTGVKKQGICGACWAFSSVGAVEGQFYKKSRKLVSFSEQQLVDCDHFNSGCKEGYVDFAFDYIDEAGGLEPEAVYPYKAKQSECQYDKRRLVAGSRVRTYVDIPTGSEAALQEAVANVGPVSVAIDASHESFQHYKSGVYDEPKCSPFHLTHGVLAIGYGSYPEPFWLVKNSYGRSWGEAGYMRMARNKHNRCGIATLALFPLL